MTPLSFSLSLHRSDERPVSLASGEPAGTYLPDMVTSFPLTTSFCLFTSQVGSVATQTGDRAESDVSRHGTQDKNGAWTLLGHTLPHPLPFPPLRGTERSITAYGLDLVWSSKESLVSYVICVQITHNATGRSTLNTGRLPIPQLPPRLTAAGQAQPMSSLSGATFTPG